MHKRFGGVTALRGVDIDVHAGEVVALVGDNGAGKSTLVKTISGAVQADQGEFLVDGEPVSLGSPHAAAVLGIATVYQDLALCENLDVSAMQLPSLNRPVAGLSGGQRQAIAVGRALLLGSKLVILDEPTAALGVQQTAQVLDLVRRLAAQDQAILLVSHSLPDVFAVADRICVVRLGANAGTFVRRETDVDEVVSAMTGGLTLTGDR